MKKALLIGGFVLAIIVVIVLFARRARAKTSSGRISIAFPVKEGYYWRLTSPFGWRWGGSDFHEGIDIAVAEGTPLIAVADGTVLRTGYNDLSGNYVVLEHPQFNMTSHYAHLSRVIVRKGQKVKKGQVIGYSGNTGRSTGPHLHFGLKRYGYWVDPMEYFENVS